MANTGRRAPLAPAGAASRDDSQGFDQQLAETKMRRALGLGSGAGQHTPQQRPEQARARHRFVQDGGVPVVMLNQKAEPESAQLRERITALEHALENERGAHQSLLKQFRDLEAQHTALQTRLAHADLAHRDAIEAERRLREAAQQALGEALAAAPRRRPIIAAPTPAPKDEASEYSEEPAAITLPAVPKRGRGRPRSTTPPDPKPIRWWTPSYRAKKG